MFWGLSMEPQRRYTQTVADSFHISQAAIDITSTKDAAAAPTQVLLEFENNTYLLATLSKSDKIYQVPLDLNFQKGDKISLRTAGSGIIHLSGYHVFEDDDDLAARLMGGDDSDEEMEEELDATNSSDDSGIPPGKRKKLLAMAGRAKKSKVDEESSDEEDDDDDDDEPSFGSTLGDSTLLELEAAEESDLEDDDEEEDEDDSEEYESDENPGSSDEEDEEDELQVKQNVKNAVVNGSTLKDKSEMTPKSAKKLNKEKNALNNSNQENTPKLNKQQKLEKTPKVKGETPKQDKTPKQQDKPSKQDKTPKLEKTPKQDGKTQKLEKTPKQDGKTPKQEKKTPNAGSSPKKVLEGGVISEDLKTGDGPVAKTGKMVQVYYVGRLKSNNKQFDATSGGPGFKFRLGRGEVIRGWDIGVQGMRVGGKRRLTIPAALAYGSKGSPPVIPPNSTLTFEVELRGVS